MNRIKFLLILTFLFFINSHIAGAVGLIAHWKFDDGTGTTPVDSSGNNITASFTPTNPSWSETTPTVDFLNPYSLDFTGSGDAVDVTWPTELNFSDTDPRSFSFWYKPVADGEGTYSRILSWSNDQLEIAGTENGTNTHKITYYDGEWHATNITLELGTWYHVTFTYDGTDAKFYIGDILQDEHPLAGRSLSGTLRIGNRAQQLDEGINGLIDDVRIYNYALTAQQVGNLSAGSDNPDSTPVNPTVEHATPIDTSTNVPVDTHLVIDFSEPMDPDSFVISTSPCQDECMTYDLSWAEGEEQLTFNPVRNFEPGTTYTITISANDAQGNPMSSDYIWSFTTTTAPTTQSRESSVSGIAFGCKDETALNYNRFSSHKQELCQYATSTTPSVSKGSQCPVEQTLTQNLKTGARGGRYHSYTKAIVTEAKILQAHLNRLGFNSGPVDGILGPVSDGAIKRLQAYLGTTPDGYVGPITRGLLNNSCGVNGLQN